MKVTLYPFWERPPYQESPRLTVSSSNMKEFHSYPSIDLPPFEIEIDTVCPHPSLFDLKEVDQLKKEKAELYQRVLQLDERIGKLLSLPNMSESEIFHDMEGRN